MITKDVKLTDMMRHFNVFESFKVVAGVVEKNMFPDISTQHSFDLMMENKHVTDTDDIN